MSKHEPSWNTTLKSYCCATGVTGLVDLSAELSALDATDRYIGDGSEDAIYELFSSSTNPLDLDGEIIWYAGAL